MLVGQQEQVEILVGFDKGVDQQQRVVRRHVVVHGAVGEEQVALEIFREVLIGLIVVVGSCRRSSS